MNQLHVLLLAAFVMDAGVAGFTFALLRRAAELDAGPVALGLLGSVWLAAYTPVALWAGRWSDRVGRRRVSAMGCCVAGLAAMGCVLTVNLGVVLGLMVAFGFGVGCFWPSMIAWLGDGASDQRLLGRLTKFNVMWNLGLLAGFGLAGMLFKTWPGATFVVSGGVMVGLAGILLIPAGPACESEGEVLRVAPVMVPKGRGFRQTAWLANFALTLGMGGLMAMFPKMATQLGIGSDAHGFMLAFGRGAALCVFVGLAWAQFWRTRLWPLWLGQLGAVAGLGLIGRGETGWVFAAGFILMGAVSGYTYQASIMFTLEEISEKGKGSGMHEAILASGMCLGPLLAGWFGGVTGQMRAPYFFLGAVMVVLVASQVVVVAIRRAGTT